LRFKAGLEKFATPHHKRYTCFMTTPRTASKIYAAIAAIACCNIAFGLVSQLLPLLMEAKAYSAGFIGFSTALWPLGVLVSSFFLPRIIKYFGGKTVALSGVVAIMCCLALFPFTNPETGWLPLRFIFGIAIASLFTVSESWILAEVEDGKRGQTIGLYLTVLTATFGVGPLVLPFTGTASFAPWAMGIGCLALGLWVISKAHISSPKNDQPHSTLISVATKVPLVFICVGAVTVFENIMLPFFTIFGLRRGLDLPTASFLLGFSIIACAFLFYPIGRLADKWSRNGVVMCCAALAAICAVLLNLTITHWAAWPLTLIMRAGAFGAYGVAMTIMGDNLKGPDLVAGSAIMTMLWGVGGIAGPPLAGAAIDWAGINALPFLMAAPFAAVLIALAFNKGQMVLAKP
jgi:MFS family permease